MQKLIDQNNISQWKKGSGIAVVGLAFIIGVVVFLGVTMQLYAMGQTKGDLQNAVDTMADSLAVYCADNDPSYKELKKEANNLIDNIKIYTGVDITYYTIDKDQFDNENIIDVVAYTTDNRIAISRIEMSGFDPQDKYSIGATSATKFSKRQLMAPGEGFSDNDSVKNAFNSLTVTPSFEDIKREMNRVYSNNFSDDYVYYALGLVGNETGNGWYMNNGDYLYEYYCACAFLNELNSMGHGDPVAFYNQTTGWGPGYTVDANINRGKNAYTYSTTYKMTYIALTHMRSDVFGFYGGGDSHYWLPNSTGGYGRPNMSNDMCYAISTIKQR